MMQIFVFLRKSWFFSELQVFRGDAAAIRCNMRMVSHMFLFFFEDAIVDILVGPTNPVRAVGRIHRNSGQIISDYVTPIG